MRGLVGNYDSDSEQQHQQQLSGKGAFCVETKNGKV